MVPHPTPTPTPNRRAPGGVFLTLIKGSPTLTEAEKAEIFRKDKQVVAENKKRARKRKREAELKRSKANHLPNPPNLNMIKRLPENGTGEGLKLERVEPEDGPKGAELTCRLEGVELVVKVEEAEPMQVEESVAEATKYRSALPPSQHEVERDLDEFEQTDTIDFDIGFEV